MSDAPCLHSVFEVVAEEIIDVKMISFGLFIKSYWHVLTSSSSPAVKPYIAL